VSYIRSGPLGQQWTPQLEDIMLHIVQLRDDDTVAPRLDFENHLQVIGAMWDQPTYDLADMPPAYRAQALRVSADTLPHKAHSR